MESIPLPPSLESRPSQKQDVECSTQSDDIPNVQSGTSSPVRVVIHGIPASMTDKEVYDSISKSFPILSAVVVKDGSHKSDCDCVVTVDAGLVGEFSEYVKKGLPFAVRESG